MQLSKAWILFSIFALILAGFLSLFIMLGRTPYINEWMFGTEWMRRILVVHVNLALTVSFYAFITGLFLVIPSSQTHVNKRQLISFGLALAGTLVITISGFIPIGEPILSNYVPVINQPFFIGGLCLFAISLIFTFFDERLLPGINKYQQKSFSHYPISIIPILQSAGIILIIGLLNFLHAFVVTPLELSQNVYFELMLWGGGHVLQFTNMAAATAIWGLLFYTTTQKHFVRYRTSFLLFVLYTLPLCFTPFLFIEGTTVPLYITGFTYYMQWGIFPVITVVIVIVITKMIKNRNYFKLSTLLSNPAYAGLVWSIFLTISGFMLGAMIRGSNTMIPAHYHATLGAVTIAFMAGAYKLMMFYGYPSPSQKRKRQEAVQIFLFGIGQTIFVSGLAVAGTYGLARKVFGEEQLILSAEIYFGLGLLLIGGLTAIIGGILFLRNILRYLMGSE
ncbi:cbb3-type cytochrome c oxidase subunit I [Gracilimonas sp.]|uniref:cbb3-type cytochrome c oxidase subunit I n=1 Tax=Gracilimonas sp. TaxID=1974203 RepID=UPI0037525B01